uniref:Uncharacterized protein n=1 Tax=Cacopsylla melanoneura TaxID=428564 RepID=A0A8D8ZLU6_9HEMI
MFQMIHLQALRNHTTFLESVVLGLWQRRTAVLWAARGHRLVNGHGKFSSRRLHGLDCSPKTSVVEFSSRTDTSLRQHIVNLDSSRTLSLFLASTISVASWNQSVLSARMSVV